MKFDLADVIKEYIKDRDYNVKDSEYLVIGQRGALRMDAINTMLERLTNEIGMVNKLKPHTFRHTFCTRLINRGVPISTVSKLAGHSSVDTTATFYIMYNLKEVGDIVVIEDDDSIEVLNKYNLLDKQSKKIISIPEFTEVIVIGDVEIMKITFTLGYSFGITLYHKRGKTPQDTPQDDAVLDDRIKIIIQFN